jgi:hypothetical protein
LQGPLNSKLSRTCWRQHFLKVLSSESQTVDKLLHCIPLSMSADIFPLNLLWFCYIKIVVLAYGYKTTTYCGIKTENFMLFFILCLIYDVKELEREIYFIVPSFVIIYYEIRSENFALFGGTFTSIQVLKVSFCRQECRQQA